MQWKNEHNLREVQTMRRYHIQDRDDYKKYNKLCGMVTKLVRARLRGRAALRGAAAALIAHALTHTSSGRCPCCGAWTRATPRAPP